MSLSEDRLPNTPLLPLAFTFFPPLLLQSSMRLGGGDTDVLSMDEHPTLTYSQHLDQLRVSEGNC